MPLDDLEGGIRKEKKPYMMRRLLFILQLYNGAGVVEASRRMAISRQTGYNWLVQWNAKGYKGLKPGFGMGGKPPKLSWNQKEELKEELKSKDNWLTSEVRALIKQTFGVTYSLRYVRKILRGYKMHYAKPYTLDYRRPPDAEEQLACSLEEALIDAPEGSIIGFLDEASPQTRDNKQRFWSFTKPRKSKNTSKYKANTFGFYPINGKEVLDFKERSKAPQLCEFLRRITEKNPGHHIYIILDNARTHIAKLTENYAKKLNITLIFLPPYSPDLNPIEYIWKSVRKRISKIINIKSEWSFKESIRTTFHLLAKKTTFMQNWLKTFQPILSNHI